MQTTQLTSLYQAHIDELTARYAPVLAKAELDALVIHSGTALKRTEQDDQYWSLRPTAHFQHWLPLVEPDCVLVIAPGRRPRLVWMKSTSYWEKPVLPETSHWEASFDIQPIEKEEQMKPLLPTGRVAFISGDPASAARLGFDGEHTNPPDVMTALNALRATKTTYEVECVAEATVRAAAGHKAAREAFRKVGASELEIHLGYLAATRQDDPDTPFKNIVAVGAHASTLHHVSYDRRPSSRSPESLLVDAGATYQGYCSDITRTWVRGSGGAAAAFLALVDGVEQMQQRLCRAIKVGEPYEALHDESHRQVAGILKHVGVAKGSQDEIVAAGITRAFYPHGLGHSLGLQCHDVGCALVKPKSENPFLRNTSTITVGQIFTIEPGVYFIDGLLAKLRASEHASLVDWRVVDELSPLGGVRIEDDIHVTGGAAVIRNLTREVLAEGGGPTG